VKIFVFYEHQEIITFEINRQELHGLRQIYSRL
jgi:hypothetical protein